MNEFVLHSKRLNIKMGNSKRKILETLKPDGFKRSTRSRSNLFLSISKKQSKRINETEPTR